MSASMAVENNDLGTPGAEYCLSALDTFAT